VTAAAGQLLAEPEAAIGLAVAALIGLAVGIERQWSGLASGPDARFAGARTFFLLGAVGGVVGWFSAGGQGALAPVLLGGAVLLVVAAYVVASRRGTGNPDATTEVAALVVLGLGTAAGLGQLRLASAAAVVVVLALHEKSRIHGFVSRLDDWELRGALQFAVLALVVLPILPRGPYGPLGGVRPRELWALALVFSALNFIGFVARRVIGTTRGYGVAGLIGGLVSSTAVTLTYARRSRVEPDAAPGLAAGVVGSCTVLLLRVEGITLALYPQAGAALLPFLALPFVVGVLLLARTYWPGWPGGLGGSREPERPMPPPASPLRLWSAVGLALLLQGALMALALVQDRFGTPGVVPLGALLGLTNMDALPVAMARLAPPAEMAHLAATAITAGLLTNTLLKLGLALGLGGKRFRQLAGAALAALGVATVLGLVIF